MGKCLQCAVAVFLCAVLGCKSKTPASVAVQDVPKSVWNSDGVKVAAFLVANDFDALAGERNSMLKKSDLPLLAHVDLVSTAEEYEKDFDANELAADQKYASRRVLIYGNVVSIDKDATGTGYLVLAASDLHGVEARLDSEGQVRAAGTKKRDRVSLVCDPGTRIIGVPTLSSCSYLDQYLQRAHLSPHDQVLEFFAGKAALPVDEAAEAVMGYAMGIDPRTPRDCVSEPSTTSCDPSKWPFNSAERQKFGQEVDQNLLSLQRTLEGRSKRVACHEPSREVPRTEPDSPGTCILLAV